MTALRRILRRVIESFWPTKTNRELGRELAAHAQLLEDEYRARGMTDADARVAARRAIGGIEQVKERHRDARSFRWMDDMRRDAWRAVRALARVPAFSAVVIAIIAVGIGASLTVFSVVHAVLLRSLPYPGADRFVRIALQFEADDGSGTKTFAAPVSLADLQMLRSRSRTVSHLGTYTTQDATMSGRGPATRLRGASISPPVLTMTVNAPLMGRLFEPREEAAGLSQVAIVSYAMWERRLERDPDIVGKAIVLDGTPYQVVGVMGPGFHFPDPDTEFWTPYVWPANAQPVVVGQIAETATFDSASREIDTLLQAARRQRSNVADAGPRRGGPPPPAPPLPPPPPGPSRDGRANAGAPPPPAVQMSPRGLGQTVEPRFVVVSLLANIIADVRTPMTIVSCAVAFVLLIACVNVAGLLSARSLAREREIWLRLALGASRGRIIRLMMTESLLLTIVGGGVGVWLSVLGVRWIRTIGDVLPRTDEIHADTTTLLVAVGLTLASGIACGLAPALWQSGADARRALAQRSSTTSHGRRLLRRGRAHAALLVVQISLAVVLLLGGGLLIRSFLKLSNVDPGYAATQVLTFQVALPPAESALTFATDLNARLQMLPGVKASGYADHLPLAPSSLGHVRLTTRPQPSSSSSAPPPPPPGIGGKPDYPTAHLVSPDFLTAMGVRVIEGRGLLDVDRTSQPHALLVNRLLARSGYLGERPIGTTVYTGGSVAWTVVGIVEDFRETAIASPPGAEIFVDIGNLGTRDAMFGSSSPSFAVRTEGSPTALIPAIRDAVRAVNPHTSPDRIATMDDIISHSIVKPRFYASTLGLFAVIAGILAVAGIYAGVASAVGRRTREIGIRVALGASRFQVLWTVAGDMLILATVGMAGGITAGIWLTRFLRQMLYELTPLDPVVFVAIPLVFGVTALSAAIVSARPAFSIAPLIALRHE